MSGATMSRELLRWLQTLDLPLPVKQPKRDLANGYLFGEIVARYWQGVELHSLENKISRKEKEANWKIMRRVFARNNFRVSEEHVLAVIECADGAAQSLLEQLYTFLTHRQLQHAPPLQDGEVPVPSYTRPTEHHVHNPMLSMMGGAHSPTAAAQLDDTQQQLQQRAREQQDEEQRRAAERAQARRAAQNRPKPKPAVKSGTIRAAADDEESAAPPVQFSSVTVKPLPPQLLSRFGGSSRDDIGDGAGGSDGNGRTSGGASGEDVLTAISRQVDKVLADTNNAPFPLSQSAPTAAEYFADFVTLVEPSLKALIWGGLAAGVEHTAQWLLGRPLDFPRFLAFHRCLVGRNQHHGAPHAAQFSESPASDFQRHLQHLAAVVTIVVEHNAPLALSALRSSVLPFLHPALLQSRSHPAFRTACEIIARFLPVALAGGGAADATAPMLGAVHEFVSAALFGDLAAAEEAAALSGGAWGPTTVGGTSAGNSGKGFVTFVAILDHVAQIAASTSERQGRRRILGAAGRQQHSSADVSLDEDGGAAADPAPSPRRPLLRSDSLASVAYYNCVSGLHSESAAARAAATQLLATLTSCGRGRMLFDAHLDVLRRQFASVDAAQHVADIDGFLARVNLLLAAVASAGAVFAAYHAEVAQAAEQQQHRLDSARSNGSSFSQQQQPAVSVTEPSVAISPSEAALAAVEAQAEAVTSDLARYLRNLVTAFTQAPSTGAAMSNALRHHLARVVGAALRALAEDPSPGNAELVDACMPPLVRYLLTASTPEQQAALTSSTPAARFTLRTPLYGVVGVAPVQRLWPTLPAVREILRVGQQRIVTAKLTEAYATSGAASKHLLGAVAEAVKQGRVSRAELDKALGPTAFLLDWIHTFCVTDRSGAGAPVVLFKNTNAAASGAAASASVSPARGAGGSDGGGATAEDLSNDEVTAWWEVLAALVPHIEAVAYVADVQRSAAQRGKPDDPLTDAASRAVEVLEGFVRRAVECIVRWYIDVSGVPTGAATQQLADAASIYDDAATISKAREWFHSVVASS